MVSLLIPEAASALGAKPGTEEYIQAAILLTFLMGVILVVASILRVGFLIENLLSHPVRSPPPPAHVAPSTHSFAA
jgi:SulP family sulfate permease